MGEKVYVCVCVFAYVRLGCGWFWVCEQMGLGVCFKFVCVSTLFLVQDKKIRGVAKRGLSLSNQKKEMLLGACDVGAARLWGSSNYAVALLFDKMFGVQGTQ